MQLTKNFNISEFHCKDGTPVPKEYYPNVQEIANNLQALRDELGVPVRITGSGYRTPSHNKKVGGVKHSQHLTASAADISVDGLHPEKLADKIKELIGKGKMKEGGIGIYGTFVHYDIRGKAARW